MNRSGRLFSALLLLMMSYIATAQPVLSLSRTYGVIVIVINQHYPLLKVLLPHQSPADRSIEIEFSEHVTGKNQETKNSEHLYLASMGDANKRTMPA